MEELYQSGIQEHELLMRQMVEEILRGQLNIDQAAVRFEANRKTVNHLMDNLKCEAATGINQPKTIPPDYQKRIKKVTTTSRLIHSTN